MRPASPSVVLWHVRAVIRVVRAVVRRYGRAIALVGAVLGAIGFAVAVLVVFVRGQAADTVRIEMIAVADRAVGAAEETIIETGRLLAGLSEGGVAHCGPEEIGMLRERLTASRWISDIGIADAEGRLRCHAAGEAQRAIALLPMASARLPRLTLHTDTGQGRRTLIVAWALSGGTRLFATIGPDEPRMPGGPAFAAGRIAVAVELLSGTAWRRVGPESVGDEAMRQFSVRSESFPIRGVVAIPAELMPVAFRWLQFQLVALGMAIAAGASVIMIGRIRRNMPKAVVSIGAEFEGVLRPLYRPVIEIATGRMVGVDLVAARERADGTLMHEQTPVLDRRFLATAFADIAPVLGRYRALRFTVPLPCETAGASRAVSELVRQAERSEVDPGQVVVLASLGGGGVGLAELKACIGRLRTVGFGVAVGGLWRVAAVGDVVSLRPDFLSLDGEVIDNVTLGPEAGAIVAATVVLASRLGMEIVARGLTREAQLDPLHAAGIVTAAGDIFGAPLTAGAISDLTAMIARDLAGTAARGRRAA